MRDLRPLQERLVSVASAERSADWRRTVALLPADADALFVEGVAETLVVRVRAQFSRAIEEPQLTTVVRGPREGFVENLQANLALVLRIRTNDLHVRILTLGELTETEVVVLHLHGVAEPGTVGDVLVTARAHADAVPDHPLD